jgi:type IV secretory pathway VirB10-like protein
VRWWTAHLKRLAGEVEDASGKRVSAARAADVYQARRALEEAIDAVHAHREAQRLAAEHDPEARAARMTAMALAAGSHVAAGAHERQLQTLRAAREDAERAAQEAAAARTTPTVAFEALIERCVSLPDALRRRLADALGATVHVVAPPAPAPAPDEAEAPEAPPAAPTPAVIRPAAPPKTGPTMPEPRRQV